ncbi:MAG: cyclic nucleotide-binding domain-containing protein [Pseudomonadota bacterium]
MLEEEIDRSIATPAEPLAELFRRDGVAVMLENERVLFVDGEEADAVYLVESGMLRCCLISEDGRRHIFSFAGAGRLIGLPFAARRHFTAEAVNRSRVLVLPLPALEKAAQLSPELVREQRRYVRDELRQRERHLLSIASLPAEARLQSFLREFARLAGSDLRRPAGFIALPMSRRDIADHLGLTLETVSRAFGSLRRQGVLELLGKTAFRLEREANERSAPSVIRFRGAGGASVNLTG